MLERSVNPAECGGECVVPLQNKDKVKELMTRDLKKEKPY